MNKTRKKKGKFRNITKNLLYVIYIIILFTLVWQIMPTFIQFLTYLVDLYKITNKTPELKFLLVCLSLWVHLKVIVVILMILDKAKEWILEWIK